MSKFIMGRKLGMTQVFTEEGIVIPVTVVEVQPCTVVRKREESKDGYNALVIGYEGIKERRINNPQKGLFTKMNVSLKKYLKEFKVSDINNFEIGQNIKVSDMFKNGDIVDVSGVSKGKGFQGNIKRHGQSRGKETHGSHYHRRPGSMGACSTPSRVLKGKKLPGHMGVDKVTVQNLDIVRVDEERNVILVKGAVPGPKRGLLTIKSAVKKK
ncbi:MAG: 50S ribosomal protein L3 [Clostridiales bacterium]